MIQSNELLGIDPAAQFFLRRNQEIPSFTTFKTKKIQEEGKEYLSMIPHKFPEIKSEEMHNVSKIIPPIRRSDGALLKKTTQVSMTQEGQGESDLVGPLPPTTKSLATMPRIQSSKTSVKAPFTERMMIQSPCVGPIRKPENSPSTRSATDCSGFSRDVNFSPLLQWS